MHVGPCQLLSSAHCDHYLQGPFQVRCHFSNSKVLASKAALPTCYYLQACSQSVVLTLFSVLALQEVESVIADCTVRTLKL